MSSPAKALQPTTRAYFCGKRGYAMMLDLQERLFRQRIDAILNKSSTCLPDTILAVEHSEPVYTIGRRDTSAGLNSPQNELPIETFKTKRGGGITWHGPGQLTMYPVANIQSWWAASTMPNKNPSPIRWYSDVLEGAMGGTVEAFGVPTERRCVGLWVPSAGGAESSRKVGSVGLQLSNWISMHGVGLNVSNDLKYFDRVVMCEMPDKRATSLHTEMIARSISSPPLPSVEEVWPTLLASFASNLHVEGFHAQEFNASSWSDNDLIASVLQNSKQS
ncbi:Hypothetical protein, putative [Bodo saltans]|uniref:lipoyl(octanoyl) transferase n=1 Tax=Bodo saltans TaxID=75058 RepID=A0A0S4J4V5_BODSA|nr:Hypothetical protein, putative [Bodo saltans]|eukprot:CUG81277.1 Hypothetical protein, putative [Bodo saltans]